MKRFFRTLCLGGSVWLLHFGAAHGAAAPTPGNPKESLEKPSRDLVSPPADRGHASLPPVYRIPLRVHLGRSERSEAAFREILEEINEIWLSQAGICFEMAIVRDDVALDSGLDLWFMPRIDGNDDWNGRFAHEHDIRVRDTPNLNLSPNPARHPAARTAAHELGHALRLPHRQDADDNLMRSKTFGRHLSADEIARARNAAGKKALPDHGERGCAPVRGER